jgi:ABC-2 type transport system permease protein
MPFVLIKNNLKLMLRSKWVLILMIIMPLITIALLSNAFHKMMDHAYESSEFEVGYRIEDTEQYQSLLPKLQEICRDNKVILQEYPDGDIIKLLQGNAVAAFVDIREASYQLYQSSDKAVEASITESIFSSFFYQVNETRTILSYGADQESLNNSSQNTSGIISEALDTDPIPSSTDYYGIIYIVYFAWCGMISLVAVISSERKSAIPRRMRVPHMPKLNHYIGKFIPCTLAIFIEVCTAWILSVLLYDIHWGNIGVSVLIIFLISMASSAFGILLFQLFHNVAVSIVSGFVVIWIVGFFGGSFQTYMYAHLPHKLVDISALYYINRTLVEFSTKGYSNYTGRCFGWLIGIILICGFLGTFLMTRKMEEQ